MLPLMLGEFRAGGDAELRFTPSGQAVCNFSIIANSAKKNPQTQEWEPTGETGWIRVNVWGEYAERCANDVVKGCRVYVVGRYEARKYTTRDGGEGVSIELTADSVSVLPEREKRDQQQGHAQRQQPGADPWATPQGGQASAPASDPWAAAPSGNDEPPF
jgi:single-strand DNA-binding protein